VDEGDVQQDLNASVRPASLQYCLFALQSRLSLPTTEQNSKAWLYFFKKLSSPRSKLFSMNTPKRGVLCGGFR